MTTIEDDEDEEAETAAFVEKFLREMTPRAEHLRQYIGLGSGMVSIEGALWVQEEFFEGMALLCAGLPPHRKSEMIKRMAPQWAELIGLMNENRKAALRALAKRRAA
jgi:hypothetical protein